MVGCCFLVNDSAFNLVIIAMVFVLYETIILEIFLFANTNTFVIMSIILKSLSNSV